MGVGAAARRRFSYSNFSPDIVGHWLLCAHSSSDSLFGEDERKKQRTIVEQKGGRGVAWLTRRPVKPEIAGSNPVGPALTHSKSHYTELSVMAF